MKVPVLLLSLALASTMAKTTNRLQQPYTYWISQEQGQLQGGCFRGLCRARGGPVGETGVHQVKEERTLVRRMAGVLGDHHKREAFDERETEEKNIEDEQIQQSLESLGLFGWAHKKREVASVQDSLQNVADGLNNVASALYALG